MNTSQVMMPTATSSASKEVVTAALLVIGGKILSGRTKDQNIGYIAEYLTAVGIDLNEVRVVGDEERAIVDALNALWHARGCARRRYRNATRRIAKANPEVAIGSYPFFDPQYGHNTNVVLRARDAQKLAQAKRAVEEMLERVRHAQSKSA